MNSRPVARLNYIFRQSRGSFISTKHSSTTASNQGQAPENNDLNKHDVKEWSSKAKTEQPKATIAEIAKNQKTMAELDAELREKMEGHAGDGGEAGVELEDGKPVAMKRGVKNNMFRYI